MTSTRLPGKVLLDLAGRPMLERQLERLGRSRQIAEIVLAVTTNPDDDPLVAVADRLGLRWYRGSEHDVLDRYAGAVARCRRRSRRPDHLGLPADRCRRGGRGH